MPVATPVFHQELRCGHSVGVLPDVWSQPAIFDFLQEAGNIDETEMFHAFNMGIGYVLVVEPNLADTITDELTQTGETVFRIGEIVDTRQDTSKGDAKVILL